MDQTRLKLSNPEACLERAKMLWEQMGMQQSAGLGREEGSSGHL